MKYLFIFLACITLFSCQQKSINVSSDLWATSPIVNTDDTTEILGCKITAYNGESFDGIIPTSIDGQRVIEIGSLVRAKSIVAYPKDTNITQLDFSNAHYLRIIKDDAFYGLKNVKSVILNKKLERLENGAFADCQRIENIVWSEKLNYIGEAVFYNNDALTSVVIPEKVDTIAAYAFYACKRINNVVLGSKIVYLGERAFANCTQVEAINLPKSLTYIGDKAFLNHKKVSSVIIPEKVSEIGEKAFLNCIQLKQLTLKNKSGTKIADDTFSGTPILTSTDAVINYPKEAEYPAMENWKAVQARWIAK